MRAKLLLLLALLISLPAVFSATLPYWVKPADNQLWIKANLTAGNNTFYVYYGGSTSYSNASATFLFYDDFDTWSGWTQYGSGVVSQDCTTFGFCTLKKSVYGDPNGGFKALPASVSAFLTENPTVGLTVELRVQGQNPTIYPHDKYGLLDSAGTGFLEDIDHYGDKLEYDMRVQLFATTIPPQPLFFILAPITDITYAWYRSRMDWLRSGTMRFFFLNDDGSLNAYATAYNSTVADPWRPAYFYVAGGQPYFIDWIRIRGQQLDTLQVYYGPEINGTWFANGQTYTHMRVITVSSPIALYDYQVELNYLLINDTNIYISTAPLFTVGILSQPPSNFQTENKTVMLNFSVVYDGVSNTTAQANLWVDGLPIANYSIPFNTTLNISQIINTTYGLHTWDLFVFNTANTSVNASASGTFLVYFNATAVSPPPNVSYATYSATFYVNTTNLYPINCSLLIDGVERNASSFASAGVHGLSASFGNGTHVWQFVCHGSDNPNYVVETVPRVFYNFYPTYDKNIYIGAGSLVYGVPQRSFFLNGLLYLLFFTQGPPEEIHVVEINGTTVVKHLTAPMNPLNLSDFFVAFPKPTPTLLTFTANGSAYYLITIGTNALNITSHPTTDITGWNTAVSQIKDNELYDPVYATGTNFNFTYGPNSFYVFDVLTDQGHEYIAYNATSGALRVLSSSPYTAISALPCIPIANDLSLWLIPNEVNTTEVEFQKVLFNGTVQNLALANFTAGTGGIYASHGRRGEHVFYVLRGPFVGVPSQEQLFVLDAEQDTYKNFTFPATLTLSPPSFLIFVNDHFFVMFDKDQAVFVNDTTSVSTVPFSDYGLTVPVNREKLSAYELENGIDRVLVGLTYRGPDGLLFVYADDKYDAKIACYDEITEEQIPFSVQVITNTTAVQSTGFVPAYVYPSSLTKGMKKVYVVGANNGTRRMYLFQKEQYIKDTYSLPAQYGTYCTFMVENTFKLPLQGAVVSALRYSVKKNAWVVVEQSTTDFNGNALLFLQPLVPYKIRVEYSGLLTLETDYTPIASNCQATIVLRANQSVVQPMPNYQLFHKLVSYSLQPAKESFMKQPFYINFTVSALNGTLEWMHMAIVREFNGTKQLVFNQTLSDPNGGVLSYYANQTGKYLVAADFKLAGYPVYQIFPKTYWLGLDVGLQKAAKQLSAISGWTYFFIALLISLLVAGFVARYTPDGAGLVGLLALWVFALLNPTATISCFGSVCITTVSAAILITLLVVAALIGLRFI